MYFNISISIDHPSILCYRKHLGSHQDPAFYRHPLTGHLDLPTPFCFIHRLPTSSSRLKPGDCIPPPYTRFSTFHSIQPVSHSFAFQPVSWSSYLSASLESKSDILLSPSTKCCSQYLGSLQDWSYPYPLTGPFEISAPPHFTHVVHRSSTMA